MSRHLLHAAASATVLSVAGCTTAEPEASPMTHRHHTVDYLELATADLPAAKRFYAAAFGWAFTDYGPDYAGIVAGGGREFGGLRAAPAGDRGEPLMVLYSEDLEASMAAVQRSGGAIVREPFSFPGGRRFHFTDPAGNELAVWSDQ